jgi:hypothetical protein
MFDDCQYARRNGAFAKPVWMGSKTLDFGGTCPQRLAAITDITRTYGTGTTRTNAHGVVLSIDTADPSGWDTQISPQPSGGTKVTRMASGRTIDIMGIHYVAEKSATDNTKLWDHTVSTPEPLMVNIASDGARLVSGTVVVQHNLAKFTAKAELSDVAFDVATCGCFPVSGSITTTLSGSRNGTETLDITGCGQAMFSDAKGIKATLTLTRCL